MFTAASSSSDTSIPVGYEFVSSSARTFSPVLVVVLPIRLTTTARLRKGFPRQFCVMWQNMRCSILFHLLVPGGKWQTVMRSPRSSANSCSPTFHNRDRMLLLPPPSTPNPDPILSPPPPTPAPQTRGAGGKGGKPPPPPPAAYRFPGKGGGVM